MTSAVSKKDGKSSEILKSNLVASALLCLTCICLSHACVCAGCSGSESLSLSIRLGPKATNALGHGQEASGPPQDVAVSKTPF